MKIFDSQRDFLYLNKNETKPVRAGVKLVPSHFCFAEFSCSEISSATIVAKKISGDGRITFRVMTSDNKLILSESIKLSKKSSTQICFSCDAVTAGAKLRIEKPKASSGTVFVERVVLEGNPAGETKKAVLKAKNSSSGEISNVTANIKRKPRLAVIVPYGIYGGGEVYLKNLMESGSADYDVTFLFLRSNKLIQEIEHLDAKKVMVGGVKGLTSHLSLDHYDGIIFYNSKNVYNVILRLKESGAIRAKVLEIYHSDFVWTDAIASIRHRKIVDKIIRVSDGLANDIVGVSKSNKVSVPVSVNLNKFMGNYPRPIDLPNTEKKVIGIVARLSPEKNIDYAVRLAASSKGFYFVSIGEGPAAARLKNLVVSLGLKNFIFLGYKDNIEEYYAHLDGLLLTSRVEGLPISIAEAVVSGVPVFTTDVGEIADFYKDLDGITILKKEVQHDSNALKNFDFDNFDKSFLKDYGVKKHSNITNNALFFSEVSKSLSLKKADPGAKILDGRYLW